MNDTFPHDTSGCATSANNVRCFSGSTVGPSGSHYIIGPLQKASGPRKKEETAMSHFWDTHHSSDRLIEYILLDDRSGQYSQFSKGDTSPGTALRVLELEAFNHKHSLRRTAAKYRLVFRIDFDDAAVLVSRDC